MPAAKRKSTSTPENFAAAVQELLPIIRMGGRESRADSIRAQREVGKIVLKFVPDKPKHGGGAYAVLGKAIGYGGEWVYRAKCFAVRYSKKEMETLLRVAPHISFAHVIQLLSILEKEVRVKFEAKLGKRHWTVKQLKRAVGSKRKPSKRSGGPQIKLRGRLKERLQDMRDVVKSLNKRWSKWREELGKFNRATRSQHIAVVLKGLRDEAKVLSDSVAARLLEVGEV